MEKYVVSLELAKRLKEAGYHQTTIYGWADETKVERANYFADVDGHVLLLNQGLISDFYEYGYQPIAAPLSDELLEQLPDTIHLPGSKGSAYLEMNRIRNEVKYDYRDGYGSICDDLVEYPNAPNNWYDRPADALAELWLWCKENGHLSTPIGGDQEGEE